MGAIFFIGVGIFVLIFGVLFIIKKINILPEIVHMGIYGLVVFRFTPGYWITLFEELKTAEPKYTIFVLAILAIVVVVFILDLRIYELFNITMEETANVCANKYKGVLVDYSKGFREHNKGLKKQNKGNITIDINDDRNKLKITPGDNIKGAALDLKKVKDRAVRKEIIWSIKEEINNNENKDRWYSRGVLYIVFGVFSIFREIIFMIYF